MQDIFPLGVVHSLKITVYFSHQKEMRHLNLKIIIPGRESGSDGTVTRQQNLLTERACKIFNR